VAELFVVVAGLSDVTALDVVLIEAVRLMRLAVPSRCRSASIAARGWAAVEISACVGATICTPRTGAKSAARCR